MEPHSEPRGASVVIMTLIGRPCCGLPDPELRGFWRVELSRQIATAECGAELYIRTQIGVLLDSDGERIETQAG